MRVSRGFSFALLAICAGALAPSQATAAQVLCLGRVGTLLLGRFGDLPTAKVMTETFGGIDEPIHVPPADWGKVGFKSLTKIAQIGEGGMGKIFLAEVLLPDGQRKPVVWKEVRASLGPFDPVPAFEDAGMTVQYLAGRLEDGARKKGVLKVRARLYNQGGMQGYAMDLDGPPASLLLEPGRDLSFKPGKGQGPVPPGRPLRNISRMVMDLSRTVGTLSRNGIFHRDLKFENVLRGKDGYVVIDFGVSAVEGGRSMWDIGTPGYMPPEKFVPQSVPETSAHDVYSLGVMAMEALLGRGPGSPDLKADFQFAVGLDGDSALVSPAKVKKALGAFRRETLLDPRNPATPNDLVLFKHLEEFIVNALHPNPRTRLWLFQKVPSPFLRVGRDGKVMGPEPSLLPAAFKKRQLPPPLPR